MRFRILKGFRSRRGTLVAWLSALATLSVIVAGMTSAQERPRTTTASPTPTPTTPAPTPVQTGPGTRIAPQLGAPPPPPILRPKPTPTPDASTAEIDEGSTLRINADLVTLNVRVIDRNNRPINGIRQDEFKVYEDGVQQPIFSFTQEEVPVKIGRAHV